MIDVVSLRDRVAGQRELLAQLHAVFEDQHPAQMQQLRTMAAEGRAAELRAVAHRLIGTLACFSATAAVKRARTVERAAALGDVETARAGLAALEREMKRLSPALAALVQTGFDAPGSRGAAP